MTDFGKYKFLEYEEDDYEKLPAAYSVSFRSLKHAYSDAKRAGKEDKSKKQLINQFMKVEELSHSTATNYIRMLEILDLIDTSKGVELKETFDLSHSNDFFLYYRNKLQELFAPVLNILDGNKPLNYKEVSKLAHEQGYELSPQKTKRVFSLLRGVGVLNVSRKVEIIDNADISEIILRIIRTNGPMPLSKVKRKVRDLEGEAFENTLRSLIEDKKLEIKTFPKALTMLFKVWRKETKHDPSIILPPPTTIKKSQITGPLKEEYNMDEEQVEELLDWILVNRGHMINITEDRMRRKYIKNNQEPPTYISTINYWYDEDIIEVT